MVDQPEPESWARYDEWLMATLDELQAQPFTDWRHPHTLFPFVRAVVDKHFQATETGKDLVTASLVGGMVAARQGKDDEGIAAEWRKPSQMVRGAHPIQVAYDELEGFDGNTTGD